MFIPEPNAKTVKIPARFIDGNLINLLTKQTVNGISNNSICEIVLHSSQISDENLLAVLDTEKTDIFLSEGTEVLAGVNQNNIPNALSEFANRPENIIFGALGLFVSIILKTPLQIKFHGTKQPNLLDCQCFIPSLKKNAESLNHAYTLISTAFEPHRRSHSGNIFQKIFYKSWQDDYTQNLWIELEHLRNIELTKFYDYLSQQIQPTEKQPQTFVFNNSTYELLKPFMKTAIREFNQDISDTSKAMRNLIFVLNEKFKFDEESFLTLKPYIVRLFEDLNNGEDSLI